MENRTLLKLERADLRAFACETIYVGAAAGLASLALAWTSATSWPQFVAAVVAFALIYGVALVAISRAARSEAARVVRRVQVLAGAALVNQASGGSAG